jgi:phosphate transport system permease protein
MEINCPKLIIQQMERSHSRRQFKNGLVLTLFGLATLLVIAPLISVLGLLLLKGLPALNLSFITDLPKSFGEPGGGMGNALLGTAILISISAAIALSLGLAIGIYLSEFKETAFAKIVRFCAEMLAGIPSIVIGLFVYLIAVLPFHHFSAWSGGLALSIIILPWVARTSEEILLLIPTCIREAGLALGLPRWRVTLSIVVKGSLEGLFSGMLLAIARASGETAPLLFTSLNNRFWSYSLTQPISSLPVQIYTYAIGASEEWHQQAWGGAIILVILIFSINLIARVFLHKKKWTHT